MYHVNGVTVSEHDYYDIIAGVRGPDKITYDADALPPDPTTWGIGATFKSMTAVVVRRALFGKIAAAQYSNPPEPCFQEFAKFDISVGRLYDVLPMHYIQHAEKALGALDRNNCALEEDSGPLKQLLRQLQEAY